MQVVMVGVMPQYPKSVAIQWEVADVVGSPDFLFKVERSGAPQGPWDVVASNVDNVVFTDTFEDDSEDVERSLFSLSREIWYRVTGTTTSGLIVVSDPIDMNGVLSSEVESHQPIGLTSKNRSRLPGPPTTFDPGSKLNKRLQLVQDSVSRRSAVALNSFSGVKLALLKRRHFGKRCEECFDPVTKHVLKSNCRVCYGTGWEGGYYPAEMISGRVTDGAAQDSLESTGQTTLKRSNIDMLGHPRVEANDVIHEMVTGRRWEVNSVTTPSLRRKRVLQFCTCTELAPTSIKFYIPISIPNRAEATYV